MTEENRRTITRNIILFGQTGAGKSSVINMLARSPVAKVSDDASGCTLSSESHRISYGDENYYTFWDTAGLNEDKQGSVSSQAALGNLLNLVKDNSVNLLVYCIRGRLVNIIRANYDLFWGIICRGEVPIVLVVTGLEGKHDMNDWWRENQKTIKKMNMAFAGHACITSWKGNGDIYMKAYGESAEKVWKLVREHCRPTGWCMPPEWPLQAQKEADKYMIYNFGTAPPHNIILFGEAGSGKSSLVNMIVGKPVAKVSDGAQGCTSQNEAYDATIGDTAFRIYDTAGLNEGPEGRVPHWQAIQGLYMLIRQLSGVSLLVCCVKGRIKENTTFNWILFNKVICGGKVPIIAIMTGLETYDDPDDWRSDEDNRNVFKKNGMAPKDIGCIVSYQGNRKEFAGIYAKSQAKLRNLITKTYLRDPWSEEKDKWFANIYHNIFVTKLCFLSRSRLEYTTRMREMISELIKATNMDESEAKKLDDALLKAEKHFRKRGLLNKDD